MENIIKTMVNTTVPGMIALNMNNLAELVPEDERAVDEVEFCPMVGNIRDVLKASVSEEDKAIEGGECGDKLAAEIAQAEKLGCFSAANGMAQITNVFDGRLFASVQVDKEGNRNITFCEMYESGEFSPKMQITQANLIMLNNYKVNPNSISDPTDRAMIRKVNRNLIIDYCNKFNGNIPLNIDEIVKVLALVRTSLPAYKEIPYDETRQGFYEKVVSCLVDNVMIKANKWVFSHKSYYALEDELLRELSRDLGMKSDKLLEKLKKHRLLYLTKSSTRYKTKVRVDCNKYDSPKEEQMYGYPGPRTDWLYCIYKLPVQNLVQDPEE